MRADDRYEFNALVRRVEVLEQKLRSGYISRKELAARLPKQKIRATKEFKP